MQNGSQEINRILFPMMDILNRRNITSGVKIVEENGKIYICFCKKSLSEINQIILKKISKVYSDNNQKPRCDFLKYWCPDESYDEEYHITQRCDRKKYFILELDTEDTFTLLGTTIMLATILREQDPLKLPENQDVEIISTENMLRHEHYLSSKQSDSNWISLNISLNDDNPLSDNGYAPFFLHTEFNSPVKCDNVLSSILVGSNEKETLLFNMDKEELLKAIEQYMQESHSSDGLNTLLKIEKGIERKMIAQGKEQ